MEKHESAGLFIRALQVSLQELAHLFTGSRRSLYRHCKSLASTDKGHRNRKIQRQSERQRDRATERGTERLKHKYENNELSSPRSRQNAWLAKDAGEPHVYRATKSESARERTEIKSKRMTCEDAGEPQKLVWRHIAEWGHIFSGMRTHKVVWGHV